LKCPICKRRSFSIGGTKLNRKFLIEKEVIPPDNMTDNDEICGLCYTKLFSWGEGSELTFEQRLEQSRKEQQIEQTKTDEAKFKIKQEKQNLSSKSLEYKLSWDKNGIIQFKNERIAILKRMVGQQIQFIVAYDDLTKEGYELKAIDEGQGMGDGITAGLSAYFYFQKLQPNNS